MRSFWGLGMALMWACVVQAGEIVAIVNDRPISDFDVEARVKMMQLQQFAKTKEITKSEKKMALDDLVDDQIKLQEIEKRGIQVSDAEVVDAIKHLEQQNGLKEGGFKRVLSSQNIPYQTLVKQTQINLGWMKLLQTSGRISRATDAEIANRQKAIRKELAQDTFSFGEIVVKTQEEAMSVLKRLQTGTDFGTLVGLYSTADSRLNGGRVMGAHRDYYGAKVAPILDLLPVGQLSRPIPVPSGYAVILMMKKQKAITTDTVKVWDLAQAMVTNNTTENPFSRMPDMSCESFIETAKSVAVPESIERGIVAPNQLPMDMSLVLKDAPFKEVIGPVLTSMGSLYFMKCQASEQRVVPKSEELRMQLEIEKMELLSRQILSELKREVVVEYK